MTGATRQIGRSRGQPMMTLVISVVILFWTLLPIYNMVVIAMEPKDVVFSGSLLPKDLTLANVWTVITENFWYLSNFWRQMVNSLIVGVTTAALVIAIGTMASFAIHRLKARFGFLLSNAALLSYAIPLSFLAIPFYKIMYGYGLLDSLTALIIVEVTFASPYAIFIFSQYSTSIPMELDEAARIDGATIPQIYWRVFLPLMMPAIIAIGTYSLLLAWNEYLYAFLLLSSETQVTVPVALGHFLSSDDSPWNILMAAALIYSLPPLLIYYLVRDRMTSGMTIGSVKG